jgi:hypothetical protein
MQRRDFLSLIPTLPVYAQSEKKKKKKKGEPEPPPPPPSEQVRTLFCDITRGYLANAAKTSKSMAVVEYPQATITQNFLAKSGLSATGTTRMLPAMAAWVAGGREPDMGVADALIAAFRNGTDPNSPDYWLPCPEGKQNQRQVESSIVAWSLWVARDKIMPALTATERRNIAAWLESCTKRPVRINNWAWFTAVNLAVCLRLSEKWPEFHFDEAFMIDDLKALDAMAAGDSGWYNDQPTSAAFDYYNSWVFASHFLYWNELVGPRYPEWQARFSKRLKEYLELTPYFFAGHGGHVLYGRSLIYRWAVVTPLILAYQQGLWPHSPGLLRHIVERNMLWHAGLGAFDATAGKLRESFTPEGTMDVKEDYIDGGHPYWGMQAFALWRTPDTDAYWTAPEELTPIEKSDFSIALPEPGLVLVGTKASGQVRIFNARSTRRDAAARDKYDKLTYSSHFPFTINHDAKHATVDNTLLLRDTRTGETACRGLITSHTVEAERIEIAYEIRLGTVTAKVRTELRWRGEFEARMHDVEISGEGAENLELVEGGVGYSPTPVYPEAHIKTWLLRGWKKTRTEDATGSVFYGACKIQTVTAPLEPKMRLVSVRYQSPKGVPKDTLDPLAQSFMASLRV